MVGGLQLLLALSPTSRSLGLRRAHRRMATSAPLPTCTRTCTDVQQSETKGRTQAVDSSAFMSTSHVAHTHAHAGESAGLHLLFLSCVRSWAVVGWWGGGGGVGWGGSISLLTSLLLRLNCRSAHQDRAAWRRAEGATEIVKVKLLPEQFDPENPKTSTCTYVNKCTWMSKG